MKGDERTEWLTAHWAGESVERLWTSVFPNGWWRLRMMAEELSVD